MPSLWTLTIRIAQVVARYLEFWDNIIPPEDWLLWWQSVCAYMVLGIYFRVQTIPICTMLFAHSCINECIPHSVICGHRGDSVAWLHNNSPINPLGESVLGRGSLSWAQAPSLVFSSLQLLVSPTPLLSAHGSHLYPSPSVHFLASQWRYKC